MKVEELVRSTIKKYNMLTNGESVLVGFSGGADSVCLIDILHKSGYNVIAAHVNHGMRDTAGRDMEFCRNFCEKREIPFECTIIAKGTLKNEADARAARYAFFTKIMKKRGISKLATAHNKNDSAETVLLHMLRGASTDGLKGILPIDSGVIRPLLGVKKSEVIDYCRLCGLEFMTDETNFDNHYTRNRLRNKTIPELSEDYNPKIIDTIADNALITAADADFLKLAAKQKFDDLFCQNGIDAVKMKTLHPAIMTRVIQLLWKVNNPQNLPRQYIEDVEKLIFSGKSGVSLDLPGGYMAKLNFGFLKIEKKENIFEFEISVVPGNWYNIEQIGIQIKIEKADTKDNGFIISLDRTQKITVRSWRDGDRFSPPGLCGSKKLSDFFADIKIERSERKKIPIICADGRIAAVSSLRVDSSFMPGAREENYRVIIR